MPRVFLSHSTEDREFVEKEIIPVLHNHNIETWYSPLSIKTVEEWERSIRKGLEDCDWFLVVMSPRSAKSEWVRTEVFWAINKRKERIIPLLHETCDPTDFHLMLFQIQYVDFRRKLEEAREKLINCFEKGEKSQPSSQTTSLSPSVDPSPFFGLGMAHYQKKDYDRAITEFTSAIELCPDYAAAYIMRGVAHNSKNEHDEAIADLTAAINLKPNSELASIAYSKRGNSYAHKEEYQKAIADLTSAIQLDATNVGANLDRGVVYHRNAQLNEALADFNQAIEFDPNNAQGYLKRAGIYRRLGQLENAKADYARAVQLDPGVAEQIPDFKQGDEKRLSQIEDALRTSYEAWQITQMDKLTPAGKMQALKTLREIGWEKIIKDLEFLIKELPKDNPNHFAAEILLNCVRQAEMQSGVSISKK